MTEQEWLESSDPTPMIELVGGIASDRKLRLFACACCRGVWQWLADERSKKGLNAAERYADNAEALLENGETISDCMRAMEDAAGDSESEEFGNTKWHAATVAAYCTVIPLRWQSARDASQEARLAESCYLFELNHPEFAVPYPGPEPSEGSAHADLLREILGNPFRPVAVNAAWLAWNDGMISKIARQIYDERAFDRLPILADALEDAGCDNADILTHCRSSGPHVRGCWVLDLLLGKT